MKASPALLLLLLACARAQVEAPELGVDSTLRSLPGGPNQHFGFALASGADWDGDGRDDLAGGGATPHGAAGTAAVRVVCGLQDETPREFTVRDLPSDVWGVSVALLRDLDGGGRADLVIGLPEWSPAPEDPERRDLGKVLVFLGERWAGVTEPQPQGAADLVLQGTLAHRRLGWQVADAGDVDGDGRSELLVGMPGCDPEDVQASGVPCAAAPRDFAGAALLFRGAPGGLAAAAPTDAAPDGHGWTAGIRPAAGQPFARFTPRVDVLAGEAPRDRYGWALAGLGDLDGDGRAEFAVGAIQGRRLAAIGFGAFEDGQGLPRTGYADVFGGEGPARRVRLRPDTTGGDVRAGLFGSAFARLGDIDGDGRPEVAVGAPGTFRHAGGKAELPGGAVFVWSGGALLRGEPGPPLATSLALLEPRPDGRRDLAPHAQLGFALAGWDGPLLGGDPAGPDLCAGAWGQNQMNGAVLVLRADPATRSLRVLRRYAGTHGDKSRFGSALALGRVLSDAPALLVGSHGQALPGSALEEGFVHVFGFESARER